MYVCVCVCVWNDLSKALKGKFIFSFLRSFLFFHLPFIRGEFDRIPCICIKVKKSQSQQTKRQKKFRNFL